MKKLPGNSFNMKVEKIVVQPDSDYCDNRRKIWKTFMNIEDIGRPILADVPTYLCPTVSDFPKHAYLPKNRTSFMDDP